MARPKALILRTAGTNCDFETDFALTRSGVLTEKVHINRIIERPSLLRQFQIMVFAGGFSYGDYISAGKIVSNLVLNKFRDEMTAFVGSKKLVIGICNGFQILVKTGLLPLSRSGYRQTATLMNNDSGSFICKWVGLSVNPDSIFTRNLPREIELPIAHAEGKFFADDLTLRSVEENNQVVLRYRDNPNGSLNDIAGIVDETGHILGMMPHPERFCVAEQYPQKSGSASFCVAGEVFFRNAAGYFE
jgi:phosphoribosylformylglycinamidine synthase